MTHKSLILRTLIFALLLFGGGLFAQEADLAQGETLFKNYCASCHNKNMKDDLTGPALGGTEERWSEYPREDLYSWIRNSQAMIADGHPRAVELWNDWKPTVMTSFTQLTNEEIDNILAYINDVYTRPAVTAAPAAGGQGAVAEETDNTLLFAVLFGVLVILAIVLARIIANLNYMSQVQAGTAPARRKTLVEILTSKGVIGFALFALVVLGGYTTVNNAINLGRQQGYQPDQPIKFSHATHAGLHQIDCQYCHDGARRSKHSVIPATNTCMNCHTAIKKGSNYGTGELSKVYASIGFNPNTDEYIEDYESLSEEDIEKIFKKWYADEYVKDNQTMDEEGEALIEDQWEDLVASLTNPTKNEIPGPIEWKRIHNLPDHVYFNHAQHVTIGQLECQTCHGPVEEMEVLQQYAPLSMGWCVNCHRETEVQFTDNEYYQAYENYHDEIASGARDKVTVEDIGGLECQKCHY